LKKLTRANNFLSRLRADESGQDLIDYALMVGFVAVAAGAIMPGIVNSVLFTFAKAKAIFLNNARPHLEQVLPILQSEEDASFWRLVFAVMAFAILGVFVLRRKRQAE
jgi:Flp pilus assembly pilin Flp